MRWLGQLKTDKVHTNGPVLNLYKQDGHQYEFEDLMEISMFAES